jgi:hypothetical protein
MGFFNSNTQVVDAILTRYGRDKLAGGQSLGITRFALSDDGVDYDLWNTQHPSGSTSFGEAIESMPVLEAFPDAFFHDEGPEMIEWQIPCHKWYSGNWVPLIYPHLLFRDCSCVVEDLRVEQSSSHKKVLNIYKDVHQYVIADAL